MSEFTNGQETTNKWNTPEAQALVRRHFMQDMESGIYASYLKRMDNSEKDPNHPGQIIRSSLARAEAPLTVYVDRHWYRDLPEFDGYFLIKVNPTTREELIGKIGSEDDGWEESSWCWIAAMDKDGKIDDLSDFFTEEQAKLVFQHARELKDAGLLE